MKSDRPKVLHEIAGRSMLGPCAVERAAAGVGRVAVVVGPAATTWAPRRGASPRRREIFVQTEELGTAHAVLAAREAIAEGCDDLLVLFADTPLVTRRRSPRCAQRSRRAPPSPCWAFEAADPFGYGRLLRDAAGRLTRFARRRTRARKSAPSGSATPA